MGTEITIVVSEPTGGDTKRVGIATNRPFHAELKRMAAGDGFTVSDLTRHLWEQYVTGQIRIKRGEGGSD